MKYTFAILFLISTNALAIQISASYPLVVTCFNNGMPQLQGDGSTVVIGNGKLRIESHLEGHDIIEKRLDEVGTCFVEPNYEIKP